MIGVALGVLTRVEPMGSPSPAAVDPSSEAERLLSVRLWPGDDRPEEGCDILGLGIGGISVFSTREAFFLGFGAAGSQHCPQWTVMRPTILVLGHVESSEEHDGFVAVETANS